MLLTRELLCTGVVDASGVRIEYTPTLRQEDAGIFSVGSVTGLFIPPNTDEFKVNGYCHSSCTSEVA